MAPTKAEIPHLAQYAAACTVLFGITCAWVAVLVALVAIDHVTRPNTIGSWNGQLNYGTPDLECATWYRPEGHVMECHEPEERELDDEDR